VVNTSYEGLLDSLFIIQGDCELKEKNNEMYGCKPNNLII